MSLATYNALGQIRFQRVYANIQTHGGGEGVFVSDGEISDAGMAADANLQTASKLTCSGILGGSQSKWQQLQFSRAVLRSTPVHIKFATTIPVGLLSSTTITLRAYQGVTPVGPDIVLQSGILGLAAGRNMVDYVMPAPSGGGTYNSVRLTLQVGGLVATSTVEIYDAYFMDSPPALIQCDEVTDYLYGVAGAALLSGINEVSSPERAIDGDLSTAATLRANVSVLSSVYQTALFNSSSRAGDSVRITFHNGAGGLLDATLISSNFNVTTYLGNTPASTMADQSSFLKLSLLPGSSAIQQLTFPVNSSFDRIRVSLGDGLANALSSLSLYEIERIAPVPVVTSAGISGQHIYRCSGEAIVLNVANPEAGASYQWYNSATGGSPISAGITASGTSYSPVGLPPGNHTFYVSLVRPGCTDEASDRAKVSVTVNPLPKASISGDTAICESTLTPPSVTFTGAGGTAPYTFSYRINGGAPQSITTVHGNAVTLHLGHVVPGVLQYELLSVKDSSSTQCAQAQAGTATIVVTPKPLIPSFSIRANN
ncbi:immunoglobulin domain-containing protein [Pedobacter deserti]|uniref:immunoglobulin domain-containing protein n=1 Tax=Pedobacter deserti TaxID=2817382 RepID=UPI00210EBF09|nr:hypothetical protein [Pedobacter sp. SYSU D00382]